MHADHNHYLQHQFPPLLSVDDLARLINRKQSTIVVDRVRRPESLPPDCTPPTQKSPVWLLSTVLEWYSSYQKPTFKVAAPEVGKRKRAPTKAEKIAAREAGLTVSEFRKVSKDSVLA